MLRETPSLTQNPNSVLWATRTAVGQPEPVRSAAVLCVEAPAGLGLTHSAVVTAKSGQPGLEGKRRSLGTGMPSNLPASQANSLALCLLG